MKYSEYSHNGNQPVWKTNLMLALNDPSNVDIPLNK